MNERAFSIAYALPEVGSWFRIGDGKTFEVVAVDDKDRTVDIQHFDGTIEELELSDWFEEPIEATEPPEDWTGSVDVDAEDTENEYEADPGSGDKWGDPLQSLDRGEVGGYSELELSDFKDDGDRY